MHVTRANVDMHIFNACMFTAVHGGWTNWTSWTSCSVTCGNGTSYRDRSCTHPAPQYGGRDCAGEAHQVKACFEQHCPVNCQWQLFSAWSSCSHTCDGGTKLRMRDFIPAQHGGDDCSGDRMEVEECNTQACPGKGSLLLLVILSSN